MADKRISKSTLSMFLRSKCDRSLFLSLHQDSELATHNMPVPLQARPGVGVLQTAGRNFEDQRNDQLIRAFGSRVIYQPDKLGTNKPVKASLSDLLKKVNSLPSVILQGKFEPIDFQSDFLNNIGLNSSHSSLIPPIAGLIPDIILVREPREDDEEIKPNGSRNVIQTATEKRFALSIIDIKHTSEANPSYSAEVALYALLLSNWIIKQGLQNKYFVTIRSYLWTRFKQGQSILDTLLLNPNNIAPEQYINALISDSEDANLRFYLPTVLHFFREDLPRVISIGDSSNKGWENLEWHVDSRCSACDWLGNEVWANTKDKTRISAFPNHYCFTAAKITGHLSQIAGMTRGARKTLNLNRINCTNDVATLPPSDIAFQSHSHLKKERSRIPARANALLSSNTNVDTSAVLASLAPWPQLHSCIAVNFDPSAGLLTGLSITGKTTAYIKGQSPRYFPTKSFVVDQKNLDDEWNALEGLLSTLSDMIDQSEKYIREAGKTPLTAQIAFWEKRQFEELCNAMGRHLPRVLGLTDRKTKALAWLFPADELIEKPDGAVSPCVVFIDDIIKRVVFSPSPHVITLFDTATNYYFGNFPVVQKDAYYREFLTNGIPRERIYEIWSNAATIKRGSVISPRNTVIQEFANALEKQCKALNSIVDKLRFDFSGHLKANAPKLSLSIPRGTTNVAFDSKLWVWWDELQYQTKKLESHQRIALDAETLEANYDAIRITNGRPTGQPNEYVFDVLTGSTEAKLDDNDGFLILGKEGFPGFPLQRALDILNKGINYSLIQDALLTTPLWSSLSVTLISFDRNTRNAVLSIFNRKQTNFFQLLVANSPIDFMNDVFITKGQSSFKWYEKVKNILSLVGNPSIAVADTNAAHAMGAKPAKSGKDVVTPLARVLWEADTLYNNSIISTADAKSIASYAKAKFGLNDSQKAAISHASEKGLTLIWGPPGTGKTQTLAACIHSMVYHAMNTNAPLKVLVTGPTYKAVEELIERVINSLSAEKSCNTEIFVGYSQSHSPKNISCCTTHLKVSSFKLSNSNNETADCIASLRNTKSTTIVATSTMQAYKLAEWMHGSSVAPIFDILIIDESSQVQVTTAISPLATIKDSSRVIIAGDHLQMPPILALEPPKGSEYLVSSIQKYLMERSFGSKILPCPLEENYRSAEDIVAYARTIGYRSTLKASNEKTSLHFLSKYPKPLSNYPSTLPWSTLWSDILDENKKILTLLHEDELSSQSNIFEAKIVSALTWILSQTVSNNLNGREACVHDTPTAEHFWQKCIGIVTPHRAQRALVIRELKSIFPADQGELIDSAVDTVEKFQGGERHTIIVTFGVGDADVIIGEETFLMQLERTNVAISRAMAKCIVVMPQTLAGHVPQDKKALETAHAIKDYVDEFCNQEILAQIQYGSEVRNAKLRYHV